VVRDARPHGADEPVPQGSVRQVRTPIPPGLDGPQSPHAGDRRGERRSSSPSAATATAAW
jgi:hypothetical protein